MMRRSSSGRDGSRESGGSSGSESEVRAWFGERLPGEWTAADDDGARVTVDREEITVVLPLMAPEASHGASEAERAQAVAGRVARFRDETRERRIAVAREAEHRFGRKLAWGVRIGGSTELFTHLAVPIMTRLRQPERQVLDTLVEAGVARSRAHALAWCVRLVGENSERWLSDLRGAMEHVATVREAGPTGTATEPEPGTPTGPEPGTPA